MEKGVREGVCLLHAEHLWLGQNDQHRRREQNSVSGWMQKINWNKKKLVGQSSPRSSHKSVLRIQNCEELENVIKRNSEENPLFHMMGPAFKAEASLELRLPRSQVGIRSPRKLSAPLPEQRGLCIPKCKTILTSVIWWGSLYLPFW